MSCNRRRRVDNIKMNLGDKEWGGVDWISLAQGMDNWRALVNAVMTFRFLSGFTAGGLSSSVQLRRVN
jgi:hypothetical protein